MVDCKICAYPYCEHAGTQRGIVLDCANFTPKRKPTTNADRIRAMSDEELAEWMHNGISTDPCDYCEYSNGYCDGSPCRGKADTETIIEWLKQPAKDGEDDA